MNKRHLPCNRGRVATRSVMNSRGDEVIDLARSNLWR
jgi:hypothetical protein